MSLAPVHTERTRENTGDHGDNDRLVHLICKAQGAEPGLTITTICGHTFTPNIIGKSGGLKGLRCIVCEELRQANRCMHCEQLTTGGN